MKKILLAMMSACATTALVAGTATVTDGILTLDGLVTNVTAEADLGSVTNVVMMNGGGVAFGASMTCAKSYSIAGDGLNATGVIEVAEGKEVFFSSGAKFAQGLLGHTFVKQGAGTLRAQGLGRAAGVQTRFIIAEGKWQCNNGDFWGGHTTADTNVTIDVREGAIYDHGTAHGVVGPVELTGGTFLSRNVENKWAPWADASLDGGVTAHACTTDSYMCFATYGFLGHNGRTNCVMDVEEGARLIIDGVLTNGFTNAGVPNRLTKRGAGELVFLKPGGWTGGTYIEGGTIVIGDARALGTGALVVSGNVTLQVMPGVTFTCPPVSGSGTITKTGAGVAAFPDVAAGVTVTVAEEGTVGSPLNDGVLYLTGGDVTVNAAAGQTAEITSLVEAAPGVGSYSDIIKTGSGTLVLPTGSETRYDSLTIQEGLVNVAAESCFGSGGVTVQDGAELGITGTFNQGRTRITFKGASSFNVPEGVQFGIHSNYFYSAGARVTKTGAGEWRLNTQFYSPLADLRGTTWVIHEGRIKLYNGDVFGGHTAQYVLTLEVHEEGRIEISQRDTHTPLCNVVLRGGRMFAYYAQLRSNSHELESGAKWKGFGLNGPITVIPSVDGRPARIEAHQCHLAHGTRRTVFDVKDGATLEVDTMLQFGWSANTLNPNYAGLVKTGGGTLKLLRPVGTRGTFDIQDGTVALGPKGHLDDQLKLNVSPRAKIVLDDEAQIVNATDLASALCGTADVWFDASRLGLEDGAAVSSVPNLGTAGGTFDNVRGLGSYMPMPPTYVADGINGRGTLFFNGSQGLVTTAYTNRDARATVFLVSKWTSWSGTGGAGRWGGPFSMTAKDPLVYSDPTRDDNQCAGALSYQHDNTANFSILSTYSQDGSVSSLNTGLTVGEPYITHSGRDGGRKIIYTGVWRDGGYVIATNTPAGLGNCDIDATAIGARLRAGAPQILGAGHTSNRAYIGQIGEVLVFSRDLTAEETATIYAYLQSKWFGAGTLSDEQAKALASTLAVEVPENATAHLAFNAGTTTEGVALDVAKTGAGTLRLGGAITGAGYVDVAAGGIAFARDAMPPQVDIWVDATDASTYTLDANNLVTNLVNKGAAGGRFTINGRSTATVPGAPSLVADGINGNATFQFSGAQALALDSYTNRTSPRSLHIYMAAKRTQWTLHPTGYSGGGYGKWGGAFSFARTTLAASEEAQPGVCFCSENNELNMTVDDGQGAGGSPGTSNPITGDPYLFVVHTVADAALVAYETNGTSVTSVPRGVVLGGREPLDIDLVQLGGRLMKDGAPQWYGDDDPRNRMWYGQIGELIATTQPLTHDQEAELFAYLRKKWLNKGTGSATPPAWLTGYAAAPTLGAETILTMADGTTLDHAADTVTLGGLATEGTVDWTRVWNDANADSCTLFNVNGDVALGTVNLALDPVPSQAKLIGFTGMALTTPTWHVSGGQGAGNARVSMRSDGYWISSQGTVLFVR
ncbi:MAG: hypothetical protein PHG74_01905 [Kiritimatiellae bacterium]|nr:hypothetical protein [Kiritimatiellia bacterium]MDD3582757.1 hypothetical protein [Kiritimatiellia bacterium]